MTDPKPPTPHAEALAKQLQESLAKRRPRTWKPVLALLAGCTLFLALFAWWMYPRPAMPLLQIIALDSVFTPDETPIARVQLFPSPEVEKPRHLSGQSVWFQGSQFLQAGMKSAELVVKSDEKGQATAELSIEPNQAMAEFLARHFDASRRLQMSPTENGRVFVWPKEAKLLIVDVDATLMAKPLDAKAAEVLQPAAEKGWRIVYLAVTGARAEDLRQSREWLETQPSLPIGPVLGRGNYPSDDAMDQARRDVLKSLHSRFTGSKAVIVQSAEAAQVCRGIGLPTIWIGKADAPEGVPSWAEVPAKLK